MTNEPLAKRGAGFLLPGFQGCPLNLKHSPKSGGKGVEKEFCKRL